MPDSSLPMSQPKSSETAAHLSEAINAIDAAFGDGYAREHPELVASLVQSRSIEAAVATGYAAHQEALELADRIGRETCETLLKLKPKFFG
ncbi:hypothetical protein [Roseovarius sp. 2305UL8-3]|uniref:hypothetical protein n=1 Tax=Roseovarius conchicola TaxID=3121636 RepID=UPI003529307A